MKQNAVLVVLNVCLLFQAESAAQSPPSVEMTCQSSPDARRLKTGIFSYRDNGKNVGTGTITIRKLKGSGNYAFTAETTFSTEFTGFHSQRWEAVASSRLKPVSATLTFSLNPNVTPVFDLKYAPARVTGFVIDSKGPTEGFG